MTGITALLLIRLVNWRLWGRLRFRSIHDSSRHNWPSAGPQRDWLTAAQFLNRLYALARNSPLCRTNAWACAASATVSVEAAAPASTFGRHEESSQCFVSHLPATNVAGPIPFCGIVEGGKNIKTTDRLEAQTLCSALSSAATLCGASTSSLRQEPSRPPCLPPSPPHAFLAYYSRRGR